MPESVGDRLKQARRVLGVAEKRDVTQAHVAAALGVTPITVTRWESGAREPDLETIRRLADVLGCTACWLAFGADEGQGRDGGGIRLTRPPDLPAPRSTPQSVPKVAGAKRRPRRS